MNGTDDFGVGRPDLVWMNVEQWDDGMGNATEQVGAINFTSTSGASFGINAYGFTGNIQNLDVQQFNVSGNDGSGNVTAGGQGPNGNQGFVHLYGENDPTNDSFRAGIQVDDDANGNTWGSLNLAGPVFNDPNCTSCPRTFVSSGVNQSDPGGNDPGSYSGFFNLDGQTSPNIQMGADGFNNTDLPFLTMFGDRPDGGGWYYSHINLGIGYDDQDGEQWGDFQLYANDGLENVSIGGKNWEGPDGAARPYMRFKGNDQNNDLIWMEVAQAGDDGMGNPTDEMGAINFRSTDGSEFGINAYGFTGAINDFGINNSLSVGNYDQGVISDNQSVNFHRGGDGSGNGALVVSMNSFDDGTTGNNWGSLQLYTGNSSGATEMLSLNGNNGSIRLGSNPTQDGIVMNDNAPTVSVYSAGNERITLDGDAGQVRADGVTLTSDARYKKNIKPLKNSLAKISKMRGVSYQWKDENKDQRNQIGVIAQEVEKIYPEFVHTDKNGMKAVNYAQMTAVLIESIKELNAKVESLENENSVLKAQASEIDELRSQMNKLWSLIEEKPAEVNSVPTED